MLQNFQGISIANSIPDNINVTSFKEGDILISNIRPYLKKVWQADRNGGCSADVFVLKANNTICSDCFLHYLIANDTFINFVMSGAKGVKMPRGDKKQMVTYNMGIPHIKEQNKISRLLDLLNKRIVTQNKIIEDLKKLKVAIRDKAIALGIKKSVFKTLDSIADIYQPQTIPTSLLSEDAEYFVYGANGIIGKYTEYNHSESQICIACRGNTCGTINFSTAKSWITGNAMVVNTDQYSVINKRYLYHYLSTINFNPLISGSGQPQIVRQPLAKLKIPTPSIEQQVGIVKVIDSFELKIEIEKKYLQSLLTQKVYLLSNMFI